MPMRLQEFIHKIEEGSGSRYLKVMLAMVAMVALAAIYDLTAFRNLGTAEGMDVAQVARNISEGRGFSTWFIRPLSLRLVATKAMGAVEPGNEGRENSASQAVGAGKELAAAAGPHPDLANAPFYPLCLAAVLKVMPAGDEQTGAEGGSGGGVRRDVVLPDLWIGMFNQLLLLVGAVLVFQVGLRLFDEPVGWVSAIVFLGTDLFWRYSLSGLPTLLTVVIFLSTTLILVQMSRAARDGDRSDSWMLGRMVLVGALVGLGGMTRYSFAWLILPVLVLVVSFPKQKSGMLVAAGLATCVLVMSPWVIRNYHLSGTPFGTAGFAVYEDSARFPGRELERSLNPGMSEIRGGELAEKLFSNMRRTLEEEVPRLGGSWVGAFFLVSLLFPLRDPTRRSIRSFLLGSLGILMAVQALGWTGGEEETGVRAVNLIVTLAPLAFIFGVSLFFVLIEQSGGQALWVKYVGSGIFCLVMSVPLILMLGLKMASPGGSALVYPPYYPPWIREKSQRIQEDGVIMSDVPWAVAWYGQRPSIWLSLSYKNGSEDILREDYEAVDRLRPIAALYISGKTLKTLESNALHEWRAADQDMETFLRLRGELIGNWEEGGETAAVDLRLLADFRQALFEHWRGDVGEAESWESFIVGVLMKREVPTGFPLRIAGESMLPEIFLADSERITRKGIQSE